MPLLKPSATGFAQGLPELAGHQVAIDGKSLRGSRGAERHGACDQRLCHAGATGPGGPSIPDKANEITAIPGLLAQLNLAGAVVTIDAMGCQRDIASAIVDQKADYVLALKENHPTLHDDIKLWLDDSDAQGHVRMHETVEKDHGRIETRRTVVSTDLDWLVQKPDWPGLQAVAMVESTRDIAGKVSCERRYYLCSMTRCHPHRLTIRHHWAIENQQHWILDVQFGEDAHRARKDHSAANLGLIRRTALNLLQQDTSNKWSIRRRKMRANFDLAYRETLLFKTGREFNS